MENTDEKYPKYVVDAKFIKEEENVDARLWPRDPSRYKKTKQWKERVAKLTGPVSKRIIDNTIQNGELHSALANSVSFVSEHNGVAIYVIVSAELKSFNGEYPTRPEKHNFRFKKVSLWPYVYNHDQAANSSMWNSQDIYQIKHLCRQESAQPEVAKYNV